MKILHSFEELREIREPVYWAMGFFDGVHRGHESVILAARRFPEALCGVLTFEEHPAAVLRPDKAPPLIVADAEQKARLIERLKPDVLLVLPFTPEFAALPAEEFLRRLSLACPIAGISVGENWQFGAGRTGNIDFLREQGKRMGFGVSFASMVPSGIGDRPISSTLIREVLAEGDMEQARFLLGHPYAIEGKVVHGRQIGRTWGFPTANIKVRNGALPPFGVFCIRTEVDGRVFDGVANLGRRPTMEQEHPPLLLECHLFGDAGDLYGKRLSVDLLHFLRGERKFESFDALKAQIGSDCEAAKAFFARMGA
ncbi:riboflavin biosynthesis protein RibF [Akkermansia glycaniphila]|uniref:riboflavin biosynthesis protein RibF n=1 Tax=Akkermansia glycaniphila TaxID=1679444 RepID=UPI001C009EFA|nr:riboflavin biosynthesis protein RibF [Akkermansia glycaniphila]MBT9449420.1 riboflavin biosynthesis protein RibF [Akkermansia glycaniphila]